MPGTRKDQEPERNQEPKKDQEPKNIFDPFLKKKFAESEKPVLSLPQFGNGSGPKHKKYGKSNYCALQRASESRGIRKFRIGKKCHA
jgi:hypothetical protein